MRVFFFGLFLDSKVDWRLLMGLFGDYFEQIILFFFLLSFKRVFLRYFILSEDERLVFFFLFLLQKLFFFEWGFSFGDVIKASPILIVFKEISGWELILIPNSLLKLAIILDIKFGFLDIFFLVEFRFSSGVFFNFNHFVLTLGDSQGHWFFTIIFSWIFELCFSRFWSSALHFRPWIKIIIVCTRLLDLFEKFVKIFSKNWIDSCFFFRFLY